MKNNQITIQDSIRKITTPGYYYPIELDVAQDKSTRVQNGLSLSLSLRGKTSHFAGVIKTRSVPQVVDGLVRDLLQKGKALQNTHPLVILPYLSESVIQILEQNNVSGIDMNGNYYIVTDSIVAIRLDKKNEYKDSAPIKNIFRGDTSMTSRFLLTEPRVYATVNEIFQGITKAGGTITLSTVSKSLRALSEQMILKKSTKEIRLLQPEKLLNLLVENYLPVSQNNARKIKLPSDRREAAQVVARYLGSDWMWSGETSADQYAVTTPPSQCVMYAKPQEGLFDLIDTFEDNRFYNTTVIPVEESSLFFGTEKNYASPLQSYLELMQLDKREREIADDIRKMILGKFSYEA